MNPSEASGLDLAVAILNGYQSNLPTVQRRDLNAAIRWMRRQQAADHRQKLQRSLAGIELPARVENALLRHGILCVEHLTAYASPELLAVPGLGRTGVKHIRIALARIGLDLHPEHNPADSNVITPAEVATALQAGAVERRAAERNAKRAPRR